MSIPAVTILAPFAAAVVIALALRKLTQRSEVRVPPDGAALNHREMSDWTGFKRGWDQTAPEPVYGERGEP